MKKLPYPVSLLLIIILGLIVALLGPVIAIGPGIVAAFVYSV